MQERHAAEVWQVGVEDDDGDGLRALKGLEQGVAVGDYLDGVFPTAELRPQLRLQPGVCRSQQDGCAPLPARRRMDSGILPGGERGGHFLCLSASALET